MKSRPLHMRHESKHVIGRLGLSSLGFYFVEPLLACHWKVNLSGQYLSCDLKDWPRLPPYPHFNVAGECETDEEQTNGDAAAGKRCCCSTSDVFAKPALMLQYQWWRYRFSHCLYSSNTRISRVLSLPREWSFYADARFWVSRSCRGRSVVFVRVSLAWSLRAGNGTERLSNPHP